MSKACSRAAEAFRHALELDENNEEARDGLTRALTSEAKDPEAARKRALEDPEVQAIVSDPAMQLILQQMQSNPAALRECVPHTLALALTHLSSTRTPSLTVILSAPLAGTLATR